MNRLSLNDRPATTLSSLRVPNGSPCGLNPLVSLVKPLGASVGAGGWPDRCSDTNGEACVNRLRRRPSLPSSLPCPAIGEVALRMKSAAIGAAAARAAATYFEER